MKKLVTESRILAVLFFGPPILVALAVLGPWELGWLPQVEGPYGQRIDPPIALPQTPLETPTGSIRDGAWTREGWALIYVRLSVCDEPCVGQLEALRQVRLALSQDSAYVHRVYLYGRKPAWLDVETTLTVGLTLGRIDGPAGVELREALGGDRLRDGLIYIADPSGNLVLSYPPDAEQQGILADLKRLIGLSRIV